MTRIKRIARAKLAPAAAALLAVSATVVAAPPSQAPQRAATPAAPAAPAHPGGCPDGMGHGMMGGMGGMGHGMGMMGGMGPGHGMGGPFAGGAGPDLKLSGEQQSKVNAIMDETRRVHMQLMSAMLDQRARLRDLYQAADPDRAAIDETYKAIGRLRQQMYESSVDAYKQMDSVLTKEQQRTLHRQWG